MRFYNARNQRVLMKMRDERTLVADASGGGRSTDGPGGGYRYGCLRGGPDGSLFGRATVETCL